MLTVYQKKPSVVVGTRNRVTKIFETIESCDHDYSLMAQKSGQRLSPLTDGCELRMVKIISKIENILIMERAPGISLSQRSPQQTNGIALVGKLLASRHKYLLPDQHKLGDFVLSHLYVSECGTIVTYIDPGNAFLVAGNNYEDLVRLLFSISASFRFRPKRSIHLQFTLLSAYHNENTDLDFKLLGQALETRYKVMQNKYRVNFSNIKLVISLRSLKIQYWLTLRNLRRFQIRARL